jgi:sulfonate transport system substrate-binding protein
MITRRLLSMGAALILAGSAVAACGSGGGTASADPSDLSKITLRVGDQKGGSRALLTAAGLLKDVKYKISWSQFTSGPPLLEAANAGAIDVGAVGNTPPIFAAAAGSKITVVGAGDQSTEAQAVLVPKNSPIQKIQDLKGKKIALAKGSSAHALFLSVVEKAGLTLSDVQPQYLQPADALAAFSAGKVDAWVIWDPFAAQAEAQTGARRLVSDAGYTSNYNFNVAAKSSLSNSGKVAALRDYLSRYRQALTWANTHQDGWASTWAQQVGLTLPIAKVAVSRRVTNWVPIDDKVITAEQQLADQFTNAKVIPAKIDFSNFVDTRFNSVGSQ